MTTGKRRRNETPGCCEGKLSGRKSKGSSWRGPGVASVSGGKQVTDEEAKPSAISEGSKV